MSCMYPPGNIHLIGGSAHGNNSGHGENLQQNRHILSVPSPHGVSFPLSWYFLPACALKKGAWYNLSMHQTGAV